MKAERESRERGWDLYILPDQFIRPARRIFFRRDRAYKFRGALNDREAHRRRGGPINNQPGYGGPNGDAIKLA